jgi:5-methylcytosine-specific restriction endonuclease McrA
VVRLNKVKRTAIPVAVKREVLARATDDKGIPRCEVEGCNNIGKELDHYYIPWSICEVHEAWNIKLLCIPCHKAKTPADARSTSSCVDL